MLFSDMQEISNPKQVFPLVYLMQMMEITVRSEPSANTFKKPTTNNLPIRR